MFQPYTLTNVDLTVEYYFSGLNYLNSDPLIDVANGTATFNVQRPRNAEVAMVKGVEIGAQYVFEFGLGASADATFISPLVLKTRWRRFESFAVGPMP